MDVKYSQDWSAYNQAQMREKEEFMEILAHLCNTITTPPQPTNGRPKLNLKDMVYCAVFKVYSLYSGRRFTSDMNHAQEKGYLQKAPHYNTMFRYFQNPELTTILQDLITLSSQPLRHLEKDFAVDATGFSTSSYDRWINEKYGKETQNEVVGKKRRWIKAHVMVGVESNIVTSVQLTESNVADTTQYQPLVKKTAENFHLEEVSADKAYIGRENLRCTAENGAIPYIPFRRGLKRNKKGYPIWRVMFEHHLYQNESFMKQYHKRSNVETTFHMIKTKFGGHIRSKNPTSQTNELLSKILCHNICVLINENTQESL